MGMMVLEGSGRSGRCRCYCCNSTLYRFHAVVLVVNVTIVLMIIRMNRIWNGGVDSGCSAGTTQGSSVGTADGSCTRRGIGRIHTFLDYLRRCNDDRRRRGSVIASNRLLWPIWLWLWLILLMMMHGLCSHPFTTTDSYFYNS